MDKSKLEKQMDFILEVDKIKNVFRQTYISDGKRKENDAEHSWHIALMACLLGEYSKENIDILKVIKMTLIHDIVEIDAGDTYAYDKQAHKDKDAREKKAAARIYGLLPDEQGKELFSLWEEFEKRESAEAKFAHAMDNLQPLMLNAATDGKSWVEHKAKLTDILRRNEITKSASEELYAFGYENFIKPNLEDGRITDQ